MKKIICAVLALGMCLSLFSGCGKKSFPATVGEVTIDKAPEKVVVLSPNLAAMAVRFGYLDKIVGVCQDNQNPTSLKKVETVGTASLPNVDKIIELKADMIITQLAPNERDALALDKAGITTVVIGSPQDLESLNQYYVDIATCFEGVLPKNHAAYSFAKDLTDWTAKLADKGDSRPSFAVLSTSKLLVAGGDTLESKLYSQVLGENVAKDSVGYAMALDQVMQANPQVLIVTDSLTLEMLQSAHGMAQLQAVQDGQVYFVNLKNFEMALPEMFTQVSQVALGVYGK